MVLHPYCVEVYNIETNRWEVFQDARTLDEAFDYAEKAIGFSKIHDGVSITDMQGFIIWDSNGFRQGEGRKLPTVEEIEK
jgi:hypothetical protein